MASSKEYRDFIIEQLSGVGDVSCRAMMGEYIIYYRDKLVGGIYDDRFLVKPTPSAIAMMPNAEMECPYEGAKAMILVDNVESREFLRLVEPRLDQSAGDGRGHFPGAEKENFAHDR